MSEEILARIVCTKKPEVVMRFLLHHLWCLIATYIN